jgi:ABC-type Fe3+-hydroxamate transport system substrate-binding protein
MSARKSSSSTTTITVAIAATSTAVACVVLGYYVWKKNKTRTMTTLTTFRIVSLNPSTTETLYDLGLADLVVGRTRYCSEHPDKNKNSSTKRTTIVIPKVGGTKDVDWERVRALQPTHILFNMEENVYTELHIAESICHTIVHSPINIQESRDSVLQLGLIFNASDRAKTLVHDIDDALYQIAQSSHKRHSFTFLYFIWHSPEQRLAGGNTYIHAMLSAVGGINLAAKWSHERYPLLSSLVNNINFMNEDSKESEPSVADCCLLSTEPFPFKEHHIQDYQHFALRETKIIDGEMVAWHGSKMAQGLRYLDGFFS